MSEKSSSTSEENLARALIDAYPTMTVQSAVVLSAGVLNNPQEIIDMLREVGVLARITTHGPKGSGQSWTSYTVQFPKKVHMADGLVPYTEEAPAARLTSRPKPLNNDDKNDDPVAMNRALRLATDMLDAIGGMDLNVSSMARTAAHHARVISHG